MKKIMYTIAFVAAFTLTHKAQTIQSTTTQSTPKAEVNPDGTLKQTETVEQKDKAATTDKKSGDKSGTRMAITEKGVPASKSKSSTKTATEQPVDKSGKPESTGGTKK